MRVLAVADVFEALTADRPYRGPLPVDEALAIIDRDVPSRLDATARNALKTHLGRTPAAGAPQSVGAATQQRTAASGSLSVA